VARPLWHFVRRRIASLNAALNPPDPLNGLVYRGALNFGGNDTQVVLNGVTSGLYAGVTSVALYGQAGDETLEVKTSQRALLDGGAGNDTLTGGSGDNILLGGAGNDQLFGSAGRNLLIGGLGADLLRGGLRSMPPRIIADWSSMRGERTITRVLKDLQAAG
jgi:hypothetical protein